MADSEVIKLVDDGDIFINAGNDESGTVTVQVHSLFLKVASPVFKAMLSSNFIEGSTSYNADHPLLLPDDNAKAFLQLCKVIHHGQDIETDLKLLPELVALADKYQCITLVKASTLMALSAYFDSKIEEAVRLPQLGSYDAICIAWILEDSRLLWRISRSLITHYELATLESIGHASLQKLVPSNFSERLRQLQTKMRSNLIESLNSLDNTHCAYIDIHKYSNGKYIHTVYGNDWCDGTLKSLATFRQKLCAKGVTKTEANFVATDRILTNVWDAVKEVSQLMKPLTTSKSRISCEENTCTRCPVDMSEDVLKVLEQAKLELRGLCLECETSEVPPMAGAVCKHLFDR